MLIYHAHPESGLYLESSVAVPDPAELELARAAVFAPLADAAQVSLQAAFAEARAIEDPQLADQAVAAASQAYDAAIAAATAARDAVAPTAWLIPAHAYTDAPPAFGFGEVVVRRDGAWVVEAMLQPVEEEPDVEDLAAAARSRRTYEINQIRWLIDRHRDEVALGRTTTLTGEDYLLVLQHVQDLRDVPEQDGFPSLIEWPLLPPELLATGE
ncbi:hypothetical protein GCM10017620_25830 [Brevundimonas intermedia]|uniref:Phage tail assembly chaperone-like domain-containing protein n=1 Tax=Brevundimonas intermedia TaxID=74315 RepID=A0ABQ5TC52_9CAUL|nr:phage tail assembly chaperone [Brevundimonas intermedia]GLK49610.1 hypothetical protein GCM10017620_25830 [Brevundimonas intermedia]